MTITGHDDCSAWADEDTAEWTLAERLRYDMVDFNDVHGFRGSPAWLTTPTSVLRTIVTGLQKS
jgi:hypothetical protein